MKQMTMELSRRSVMIGSLSTKAALAGCTTRQNAGGHELQWPQCHRQLSRPRITRTLVDGHAAGPVQQLLVDAELESCRLVRILPDYEVKPTEAFLTYPSVRFMRPVVKTFSDFAIQELRAVEGIAADARWTEEISSQSVVQLLASAAE